MVHSRPRPTGACPPAPRKSPSGSATASELGVVVGDTVTITPLMSDEPLSLKVTGIVVSWGLQNPRDGFVLTSEGFRTVVCGAVLDDCDVSVDLFADAEGSARQPWRI